MNTLKRRVTVGLFGVVLVAAACGGGSSSSTSTTAKPSRGFTSTTSAALGQPASVTCAVGGSTTVEWRNMPTSTDILLRTDLEYYWSTSPFGNRANTTRQEIKADGRLDLLTPAQATSFTAMFFQGPPNTGPLLRLVMGNCS
jgi:hypothetical protein